MTLGGWIFMLGSVGTALTLAVFCYSKVLSLPPAGPAKAEKDAPIVRPPPGA